MNEVKLGSIERFKDPREVWPDEARDFTPWLKENLDLLGEALGLELEAVDREVSVGPFSADILAKELTAGTEVVIENQLEQTDHTHLGQLITYASGLGAGIVIWVSRHLREEHRQALDWLNQNTSLDIGFYGVEIEVFKIGDSLPAPYFNVAASPNEPVKTAKAQANAPSGRGLRYQEFWKQLIPALKAKDPSSTSASPDKAGPYSWFGIPVGRTGFAVNFAFTSKKTGRAELYIDVGNQAVNKLAFDALVADKTGIEGAFGEPLMWTRLDDKQASRIFVECPGSVDDSEDALADLRDWAVDRMLRLRDAFAPRIKQLDLSQPPEATAAVAGEQGEGQQERNEEP